MYACKKDVLYTDGCEFLDLNYLNTNYFIKKCMISFINGNLLIVFLLSLFSLLLTIGKSFF